MHSGVFNKGERPVFTTRSSQDEVWHITEVEKSYSRTFSFVSMVPKWNLALKKCQSPNFTARSSSRWVLIRFRTLKMDSCFQKKQEKNCFYDQKFFRMSSYTFQNFRNHIPDIFHFHHMVLKCILVFKKAENPISTTRSSSGWVLTHFRTFRMVFLTFFIFIIWS